MCIVVDIDGTFVEWQSDRPDWSSYSHKLDKPIEAVMDLVKHYSNKEAVIFLSARPEICREQTENLLKKYSINYTALILRQDISQSATSFKKEQIKSIQKNYGNITFAIEDAPQNVRMFVNSGIFVLDVGCNFRS